MSDEKIEVHHEPDRSRFVVTVDGEVAGFASYVEGSKFRNFNHTVIKPEFRGRGLTRPLVKTALDTSRDEGVWIHDSCSVVAEFIRKNPEYEDLKG